MSEPMSPPPPPYAPPPPPMGPPAAQQVQGPAIGLLVVGGLGAAGAVLAMLQRLLGMAMIEPDDLGEAAGYAGYILGAGIVFWVFVLVLSALVIWGALQMKSLRGWTVSVIASVLTMIPCLGPCCGLGLPIGIWALVVLLKPEVKAAFTP